MLESTRSRLRPIYMSVTTSIFGMLPLVLFQGSGSELYRGLGSILIFVIRMEKPHSLDPAR